MEVLEAVRTMLAVRSYQEKPVPQEVIQHILEAGRLTGSSKNLQPWHFIVVEDHTMLRQLGALVSSGSYVAQAPLAIVVAVEKSVFGLSDASRAIQSMILAAWSEGVGSNWVGFPHEGTTGMNAAKPLLGIPQEFDLVAILPFGYPAQQRDRGKKRRKPLAEVAHRERFGQPFE